VVLAAVTVKANVPTAVGVPVNAPEGLRVSPGGSAPAVTAKVYGPGGPDAVIVWLYATPPAPFGRVAGASTTGTWSSTDPMSGRPLEVRRNPGPRWSNGRFRAACPSVVVATIAVAPPAPEAPSGGRLRLAREPPKVTV
jgi:hypothetical protein